jgi:tRNA-Thr(GGU) m(6)t(6)A37 methyltransferase TsaA
VSLRPIGVVRNNVFEPMLDGWEDVRSDVIVLEELMPALDGIEQYSHIIVVFALHLVPESERALRIHPRGDPALPEQGVLATRSQRRPNPIGVSVVPLLRRRRNVLRVGGLDAIDGTPVLDIKPYLPPYDSVADATMPDWTTAFRAPADAPQR